MLESPESLRVNPITYQILSTSWSNCRTRRIFEASLSLCDVTKPDPRKALVLLRQQADAPRREGRLLGRSITLLAMKTAEFVSKQSAVNDFDWVLAFLRARLEDKKSLTTAQRREEESNLESLDSLATT